VCSVRGVMTCDSCRLSGTVYNSLQRPAVLVYFFQTRTSSESGLCVFASHSESGNFNVVHDRDVGNKEEQEDEEEEEEEVEQVSFIISESELSERPRYPRKRLSGGMREKTPI